MIPKWAYLDEHDRGVFRATIAFLNERLAEQGTIDWALGLGPTDRIQRIAIEELLESQKGAALGEPWRSAWRLIEESWSAGEVDLGASTKVYEIQERLVAGDYSGSIISAIIDLVAPLIKAEPLDTWRWQFTKKPRYPKAVNHLLSVHMTSGELVDLNLLQLNKILDIAFLTAVADGLESAVIRGLDIGRRLGWDGGESLWPLGDLRSVYYTSEVDEDGEDKDPDAYNRGIAPSVKLLFSVVSRIAEIDILSAVRFVKRWDLLASPIHRRLWAAAARNVDLVSSYEVEDFLLKTNSRQFWDLHSFPEIAELRALRFSDLSLDAQNEVAARIRKGPPRDHWPKKVEAKKIGEARQYWAIRELRRIEICGGNLPLNIKLWLDSQRENFPDLKKMGPREGFLGGPMVRSIVPNADTRYNALNGVERLQALEAALGSSGGLDGGLADRANDWLLQSGNSELILSDLTAAENGGDNYPKVWDRFGWIHSPEEGQQRDPQAEADQVITSLSRLSEKTLLAAVGGISTWLDRWRKYAASLPLGSEVWLRVWPIAVKATNAQKESDEDVDLDVAVFHASEDEAEPKDLDTLNVPAGKLVGTFLSFCPDLSKTSTAFAQGTVERQMRDALVLATGRSGLITKHRLIEFLPYFLRADHDWAEQFLVTPLLKDDSEALALWRAIARRTLFTDVLTIIGEALVERATDRRLGRKARQRLVFSLVVESLHAFRENRDPAVANPRIQQMLRTLDDEVRAHAAGSVQKFVRDLGTKEALGAADVFRHSAAPFLREVWPQERSLATPGVSGAFADLPATSGEAFSEAVNLIERFLVPFDCWSMTYYGLRGRAEEHGNLQLVNTQEKAAALLRLLDLTVGAAEGAVIPHDLTDALDQVRLVAPQLVETPIYRRLATAARR
ncbi:hypothetical protein [Mesorhizobium sp. KR9-304]|uniref:hypothetical protein n=1 Tax=Mesorhizobium sp. KR9-304 TaxID=3156614 RepID=UPI0032B59ADC